MTERLLLLKLKLGKINFVLESKSSMDPYLFMPMDLLKALSMGSIVSSPVYKNGIVYVGGGDGKMYALQSSTGNLVWINSDTSGTQNIYSRPTLSERAVYSGTLGGKVVSNEYTNGYYQMDYHNCWCSFKQVLLLSLTITYPPTNNRIKRCTYPVQI